MLHLKFG